jgi:Lrp/AsnC family transcriptional regulator of lysine biosynthesis
MDEVDEEILDILRQNSRAKYVKIAGAVGLTEGAIRKRVKKMLRQDVIKKFTIETRTELGGVVLIKTEPDKTRNVAANIKKMSDKVFEVSGDYDVAALIQARTIDELNKIVDEIRELPGVIGTNTLVKLTSD